MIDSILIWLFNAVSFVALSLFCCLLAAWIVRLGCRWLWNFAEARRIDLGRIAPIVFSGMIGRWPHRQRDDK